MTAVPRRLGLIRGDRDCPGGCGTTLAADDEAMCCPDCWQHVVPDGLRHAVGATGSRTAARTSAVLAVYRWFAWRHQQRVAGGSR